MITCRRQMSTQRVDILLYAATKLVQQNVQDNGQYRHEHSPEVHAANAKPHPTVESAPDENPATAKTVTGIATQEQARTAPVTAPQAEPIASGADKTEPSSMRAPATLTTEAAAATNDT
jgi:hypothetical protein